MGKYIDAEELKERFLKGDFDLTYHWDYVRMIIDEMPSIILTDKFIDEYIDDHFQELLNALVRRIAKIIKEECTKK